MPEGPDDIAAFLAATPSQPDVAGLLNFYADKYGVDRDLVRRIAKQESGFKPKAVSSKGAIGVMQLMPQTAAELGVNPRNPEQNIEGGVRYLKQQLDEFKSVPLALAAYNAGPSRVRKAGGVPKIRETQQYVGAIAGQDKNSGDDIAAFLSKPPTEVTAAHEAIMRDGGVDLATADKMVKSGAANHVAHLPPAVPTAKAPIDQIAAQYEVLKASGDLAKLSPEDYAVFTAPLKAAHWEVGADYIKPPTEAPGAYPLWERQIAGQLKQGELPQGQAWYERSALGRTARKVFEPIGGMIEQGAKAASESVVGTLKGDPFAQAKALKKLTLDPQLAELQRGYDMWEAQGGHDSPESIAHGLAGLIPFLGPVAASFGEKAGTGVGKVTAGDTRGWEDIIGSIPDAVMLAAPLITKGFEAMKSGVPAEQAMASVADQLKPLLEKRLKETIAPEGGVGTGAKPRIVAERGTATPQSDVEARLDAFQGSLSPNEHFEYINARDADPSYKAALKQWYDDKISTRDLWSAELEFAAKYSKEVTNAGQRPQVLSQAGPPSEARGGVGGEAGNVAQEGAVGGVRGGEQGQGPPRQVASPANPNARTMMVNGEQRTVELTPEQAAKFDEIDANLKRANESPFLSQEPNVRKGRAMAAAAEKRQLHEDLLTDAEKAAKAKREATNYIGKQVVVDGKPATVLSNPFGRVRVQFEDGTTKSVTAKEVTAAPKPTPLEATNAQEPIPQAIQREGAARPAEAAPIAEGQIGETTANRQGERSLPTTLAEAGLEPGTDLTYDVAANPATVAKAQENVASRGVDAAAEYVRSAESPTAEHVATGFATIRALQDAGEHGKAADLASDLSAKLTTSGQAVQAVKTIAEFAPERAVVTAQKVLDAAGKGRKLTPIQAERVTKAAQAITEGNGKVAAAEAKVDAVADTTPPASPANWRARLLEAETAARQRLAERQKVQLGPEAGSAPIIPDLADLAIVGAAKLARKGIDFATWSGEMLSEFGDSIKPHLNRIYRASFEQYKATKADAYQAMKERAVQKGLPPMTAEELATAVKQRDLAIKARTAATRQLAAEYEALQPGQRVKRELVSAMNAPRSIKASLDLSAPLRQGAVFVTEPKIAAKAFGQQISALREAGYEKAYRTIQRSPEFDNARTAGLEFTGSPLRGNDALSLREEAFMSRWAEKIPGVAASERAYVTYLDTLRINLFEKYAAEIRQAVKDPKAVDAELKSVASFINKATGRGDLGKYGNAAAPVLNSVFFAPRYAISRLQILNPATYAKMTPVARGIALRKMFQFTGLVGTTLALAKASGMQVGTDVESPDFLKIKVGDTRFDLLAGEQQYMRAAARLAKGFYANATGEKLKDSEQPASVAGRFARSKLAPIPGTIADLATGKTFEGQPVVPQAEKGKPTPTTGEKVKAVAAREGSELFTPLFIKDAYDAWKTQTTGVPTKVAATVGGLLGVGVQTYANKRAEPTEFKKLSMEDAAKAYGEARPEQRLQLRRELIKKRDAALQHAKTLADRRRIMQEYQQAMQ